MLGRKALVCPGPGEHSPGISGDTMVADKQEYGIAEIFFFGSRLDKSLVAEIGIAECIHLLIDFKPAFPQRILRARSRMKGLPVFLRDRIGAMVIRRLNDGEKRSRLLLQYFIGFQEQVLIADAPYIHFRGRIILLLIQVQPLDIIGQQASYIRPAGAATQEIKFIIAFEIIDDRMLIDSRWITAGRSGGHFHVGNSCNKGPNPPGRSIAGGKTMIEEYSFLAHTIEKRRSIQRVPPHRHFITTERFTDHYDYVRPGSERSRPGQDISCEGVGQAARSRTGLSKAEIRRQYRQGLLHFRLIIYAIFEFQTAEKRVKGV